MSATFDDVVDDCLQALSGFGLASSRAGFLTAPVSDTDLSFPLRDVDGFEQGVAEIESEMVFIESVDRNSNILTIAPDGRGWAGTSPAAHAANKRITMAPTWPRSRVASAINEAIIATYPTLFGVGTTAITFSPANTTYELPADAERVLSITTDTPGPSREQPRLNRFSFNGSAPTDIFPSGKSVTVEAGGWPGRTMTVTYAKAPSEITVGDNFTDSGLSDTARTAVRYAACASLTALMDTSRLPVDTAQADEYDQSRAGIGTAARVSTQLYQRYLVELDNERKRLRALYPPTILLRTR